MRLIFISLFIFMISGVLLLPNFTLPVKVDIPDQIFLYGPLAIMVLTVLLQFEALSHFKLKAERLKKAKKLDEMKAQLQKLLDKENKQVSKLKDFDTKNSKLSKELSEEKTRLAEFKNKVVNLKNSEKNLQLAFQNEKKLREKESQDNKRLKEFSTKESVLTLLSLLQQHGRFVDFLMDDVTSYDDEQVGSAARIVHHGCAKVLAEYFDIKSIEKNEEGAQIKINSEDIELYSLLGEVESGTSPVGKIVHKGWATSKIELPEVIATNSNKDNFIISPVEVEVR